MKKDFLPYYVSRAIVSFIFAILVMGITWKAMILTIIFWGLFLLYLHSGWFQIDPSHPLMPLRRDACGQEIQRKALIAAFIVGLLLYVFAAPLSGLTNLSFPGNAALSAGVITYFTAQFILFARA